MKKSELLRYVLANNTFTGGEKPTHLCNKIGRAAVVLGDDAERASYELGVFIGKHIAPYTTVDSWLYYKHGIEKSKYPFYGDEMMEYRRLWTINMVEYFESIGE